MPFTKIYLFFNLLPYYNSGIPVAQLIKNPPAMQEIRFDSWVGKIHWRRDRLPIAVFLGFPCGSAGKESTCNAGDLSLIPGLGRSPGEGNGYPLQYSGLENSIDCIVHGVTKSQTRLSDFHFLWLAGSEFSNQVWFKPLAVRTWSTNHWTAREFQ